MERTAYIDTHVVVWLHDGELFKFSETSRRVLESHVLFMSEFVRLELQYLHAIGKLAITPGRLLDRVCSRIELFFSSRPTRDIIDEAMRIGWTRDPFDRLITANAAAEKAMLVTRDEHILSHYERAVF